MNTTTKMPQSSPKSGIKTTDGTPSASKVQQVGVEGEKSKASSADSSPKIPNSGKATPKTLEVPAEEDQDDEADNQSGTGPLLQDRDTVNNPKCAQCRNVSSAGRKNGIPCTRCWSKGYPCRP